MPRYRVIEGKVWLHMPEGPVLYQPGSIIKFDGWPNAYMEPLNDEAKAIVAQLADLRASGRPLPPKPSIALSAASEAVPESSAIAADIVPIPDDWRQKTPLMIFRLARQLFGDFEVPEGMKKSVRAAELIEAEELRRDEAKAA